MDTFVGTSEEKNLITFIENVIQNLQNKYEEVYKIYDFETGRGFQPDFILFLKNKETKPMYYQVFIEPKGENLLEHDQWKGEFLEKISEKYGLDNILGEDKNYYLIGLPFFNQWCLHSI
ncbi:MAG: hypothetical protein HFP81_08435 [Methylococcales symbiont of Hymedesmia sp. n. MRB-2018]|nr:MAG: hypothetical protein HFP78_08655 [Methylococcales symbiont of Hymedesmia sp. n. MRB-2018]KAF3983202.1 MAG: hypothetical protein HFP81_08435 [Methylococcales symbiont of Hymedesmia sp. n. MRB-2018]